jgi:hypothetical protein
LALAPAPRSRESWKVGYDPFGDPKVQVLSDACCARQGRRRKTAACGFKRATASLMMTSISSSQAGLAISRGSVSVSKLIPEHLAIDVPDIKPMMPIRRFHRHRE